ncbi:hypothetical protein PF005_g29622 [Phytophthora fragariae]|uniref:RxLR effector protein n=1 Tax=Phytophthora fragariae TaxID=53985 RepID=A0A6A3DDW6_9STRA|nr:hypothetical protein PF003_g31667 [Phytophthora fragariae]KAE8919852.1 hypothetical protein PF009_g29847 [Phytophthora fragariae]KAE8964262.1 hypothetical protein PF011_g28736 [Phytophthora fragariae]KAE9062792.1 hypothetical protein PF010_g29259 [Phytophthora fragariae]KAE9063556.1 hypothetical protein PF007_g29510 [Phytophthora fragariae]
MAGKLAGLAGRALLAASAADAASDSVTAHCSVSSAVKLTASTRELAPLASLDDHHC